MESHRKASPSSRRQLNCWRFPSLATYSAYRCQPAHVQTITLLCTNLIHRTPSAHETLVYKKIKSGYYFPKLSTVKTRLIEA